MAAAKRKITVRMLCIYSGDGVSVGPGETIQLEEDEARRLVDLGVAEPVEAPAA